MQFSILGFERSKVLNRLLCIGIEGVNNCLGSLSWSYNSNSKLAQPFLDHDQLYDCT